MSTPFDRSTFAESFDLLLKVQAPKAKNTAAQAEMIIRHMRPWFEKNCPYLDEFETNYESLWADYRIHEGRKRKLGHDRRYLVMTLRRALAKGWISKTFKKSDFALNESTESIGKYVEDEDIKKLLAALSSCPRTLLQVRMALFMGMRLFEILQLRVVEVDLKRREINLDPSRLKIRKPRKVPVPIANAVYPGLAEFIKSATGLYVFPARSTENGKRMINPDKPQCDNRSRWNRARKESKVNCRFHDLRHTCLTNALAAGMPPLTASKIFGATITVINSIYDHVNTAASESFRSVFDGKFEDQKVTSPEVKLNESEGES